MVRIPAYASIGPIRDIERPWRNLVAVGEQSAQAILAEPHWVAKQRLSEKQRELVAQEIQRDLAGWILSPLLRAGARAWEALGRDVMDPRIRWRAFAAKWAVRGYPAEYQLHLWTQSVPVLGGRGPRILKAVRERQAKGTFPRSFERRLVVRVRRAEAAWEVESVALEPAKPGDEVAVRVEMA